METIQTERRASRPPASASPAPVDTEKLVRQAIALQASVGTLGAVEYLKANRIHGSVIGRVLSGAMRTEDRISRDHPVAWE